MSEYGDILRELNGDPDPLCLECRSDDCEHAKTPRAGDTAEAKCRVCQDAIREGENGDNRCFFCFMNHRGEAPGSTDGGKA